jgi:hypothetical protein
MEPLVCFGACLVLYCGYISIADAVRDWKARRLENPAPAGSITTRGKATKKVRRPRFHPAIIAGRPLMQRAS